MATTPQMISEWFDAGVEQGATHMVVVCDSYDWEDYPVYVKSGQDVNEVKQNYSRNMQKVMEIYDLSLDKGPQLAANRTWNT